MPNSLDGRVALIIGGAGGIGAATARLFAGAGARIVITHATRSAVSAAALGESLPGAGHVALAADVAETPSLLALRDAVLVCATSLRFSTGTTVVVDGGRSL
jgi:3-oxoacyl-[acyl-carrier protein] reductase